MLQTIPRDTPTKGDVFMRLNVTQTASRCTIRKSEIKCEVKREVEEKERKREHPLLYKVMDPTLIQIEQMIQKVKI